MKLLKESFYENVVSVTSRYTQDIGGDGMVYTLQEDLVEAAFSWESAALSWSFLTLKRQ